MQTLYLGTHFNPIYWNTACLIVNSGSLETEETKNASTDYAKVAKAIGAIQKANIKVGLVDINKSQFGFIPDVEHNQILFGLKGMLHVGDDVVKATIEKRPFVSIKDYIDRVNPNKQAMISLIKGGAFDNMMDRKLAMGWYLWETCDKKKNVTTANMSSLIKYDMLPKTDECKEAFSFYEFTRYLKAKCKYTAENYKLSERAIQFLENKNYIDLVSSDGTNYLLGVKAWDKVYQSYMIYFKSWLTNNQSEIKENLNKKIFKEDWDKYAQGNISAWEMEVLCFYYHDHELKNVNFGKYGLLDYFNMPETPVIDNECEWGGHKITHFKISKICGTCIAKNKMKSVVSIQTLNGVVNVKFSKDLFAMFDKKISQRQPDGTKKTIENSWFDRGSMIVVQGFRRDDNFVAKKYASSSGHIIYKILNVESNGDLSLRSARLVGDEEEEE